MKTSVREKSKMLNESSIDDIVDKAKDLVRKGAKATAVVAAVSVLYGCNATVNKNSKSPFRN